MPIVERLPVPMEDAVGASNTCRKLVRQRVDHMTVEISSSDGTVLRVLSPTSGVLLGRPSRDRAYFVNRELPISKRSNSLKKGSGLQAVVQLGIGRWRPASSGVAESEFVVTCVKCTDSDFNVDSLSRGIGGSDRSRCLVP